MSYEPNFEATRNEADSPAPWHVRKLDGTGELHLSDWDAQGLAHQIHGDQPRLDDEWYIPPQRWDDHPHLLAVSKAAWRIEQPRHAVDHDRYAAELVAALADQGLAVVACTDRTTARLAAAATDEEALAHAARQGRRLAASDLRRLANYLDPPPDV